MGDHSAQIAVLFVVSSGMNRMQTSTAKRLRDFQLTFQHLMKIVE